MRPSRIISGEGRSSLSILIKGCAVLDESQPDGHVSSQNILVEGNRIADITSASMSEKASVSRPISSDEDISRCTVRSPSDIAAAACRISPIGSVTLLVVMLPRRKATAMVTAASNR